jgi:hypothetical protein
MSKKSEPWYIHAALYVIIIVLSYLLIRVAIIEPTEVIEAEAYYKSESRLRMANIKSAEILWEKKFGSFTDNLNDLVNFIKGDQAVQNLMVGTDSITGKSSNPFSKLTAGEFIPDSLFASPKSFRNYVLKVDSTINYDTVINRRGKITKIDTVRIYGELYYLECPDGYGTVGAVDNNALKNTASWE